jgi:hypothetical protein
MPSELAEKRPNQRLAALKGRGFQPRFTSFSGLRHGKPCPFKTPTPGLFPQPVQAYRKSPENGFGFKPRPFKAARH